MAQMNKRPAGVTARTQLEKELTATIENQSQAVETGKVRNTTNKYHRENIDAYLKFAIKQGKRRRHPDRVLSQYAQIVKETTNADSVWEKALMHEQERVEVPEEYKVSAT